MTHPMTTKVRLVRCPKCRLVLPEMPEIPVYQCGGCNTVLQAKYRKPEPKEAELDHHEADENGSKQANTDSCLSYGKQKAAISPIEESSVASSSTASTSKSEEYPDRINMKLPQEKDFFMEVPLSPGRSYTETEDSSPEQKKLMEQDKDNNISDHESGQCGDVSGEDNSEWHRGRRLSDDVPTSMELTSNEMDSSPELQPCMELEKDGSDTARCTEANEIVRENGKREYIGASKSFGDVYTGKTDSRLESGVHEQRGNSGHLSRHDSDGYVTAFAFHGPEVSSVRGESRGEADVEMNGWILESLRAEGILDSKESDSINDTKNHRDEKFLAASVLSPDYQHLHLPRIPHLPANSRFELNAKGPELSKSPTRSYYAGSGSISSYDEMDNQVASRNSKPSRRRSKPPASSTSVGPPSKRESGSYDFLRSNPRIHYQGYNTSGIDDPMSSEFEAQERGRKSTFLETNHNTRRYGKYSLEGFPETNSHGHYNVSRERPEKEEYVPTLPRDLRSGQRNSSPLSYYQGLYSSLSSPDTPLYNGPDKLELLKMINDLKNELNRTRISNLRFPGRFSGEQANSAPFYHQVAAGEGVYPDFVHSSHPANYSQPNPLPRGPRISRNAFSAEAAANYSLHGNCTCLHCFPQVPHQSGGSPLHTMCCNKSHCLGQTGRTFYQGSYPSSSSHQIHTGPCEDCRHRETENRRHVRERDPSSKRLIRPAAGGIPLLSCYHCSELLQLPADFLLSGRKCHQLRCNACRKVMKFSLQSGRHLVPCIPDAAAPPPSMVDDFTNSFERRELASLSSHPNKFPKDEMVSFSEEYGMSFERSCSMERECPAHIPPNKTHKRALEPFNDLKARLISGKGKFKEVPSTTGAALHRLMGYASPSQVTRH